MNETQKKIIIVLCMFMFLAMLLVQSIVCNREIRRADIQIDTLERELATSRERVADTQRELEDSRNTIRQCYNSVERIAENTREQSAELSDIIRELTTIREEIKVMENALNFFYIKHSLSDNAPASNDEVTE
jgi:predicted  nucleic acid-binding Zn-ribbon protein